MILNLILAAAMNSLPDEILFEKGPNGELAHTGDMLKLIAAQYIGPGFAAVASVVFAALLLSAVNTAIGAPGLDPVHALQGQGASRAWPGLNRFGMPKIPLVVAAVIPALVLVLFPDVEKLAGLYAIGVVGAIAIKLASTSTNRAADAQGP